jgi:protein-L-isoaspartate(D-aspartate) O-methyltransferase
MGIDMDWQAARRAMVDSQLRPQAVTDPLVVSAMAVVPREKFVPEQVRAAAYIDRVLQLGDGRFLNPPATLGRLLTELQPRPGERALVIGTAPAYAAAVLREMGLQVRELGEGDLTGGDPEGAPYDLILLDGSVEFIPDAIPQQLREGGRLGGCLFEREVQRLVIGRRAGGAFGLNFIADGAAAPLPGFERPRVFTF